MGNKYRIAFVSLLAAAGVVVPPTSFAAAPTHLSNSFVTVSYADLDIQSKAGAKVLYSRLKRASKEVCGIEPHVKNGSLAEAHKAHTCYRETLEASVENIDSNALTEVHAG